MSRVKYKGPYVENNLIKKDDNPSKVGFNTKTYSRSSEIIPGFVGKNFQVYNGKSFINLKIVEDMVGKKLGEFCFTRQKFSFKKKKKIKMGQKTNLTVVRLGRPHNTWQFQYYEQNIEEGSLYVYNNFKIKQYLSRIFKVYGLILHNCKILYSNKKLDIIVSYYITTKAVSLINRINKTQKLKFQHKKTRHAFQQKRLKENNPKFKRKLLIKKIKNNKLKHTLACFDFFETNQFAEKIIESINEFTKKKFDISIVMNNLNKSLSLRLKSLQAQLFRKTVFKLRRYAKLSFFKEMVNIIMIVILKRKSSKILADFVSSNLSLMKRHNRFLSTLKRCLSIFVSSKLSHINGIKIIIGGRFNGRPRAKHKIMTIGQIPLQSISHNVDSSQSTSFTPNGTFGVKVWICEN